MPTLLDKRSWRFFLCNLLLLKQLKRCLVVQSGSCSIIMRLFLLVLILLVSACAAMAQEAGAAPPVNIDNIYVAKDDGTGQAGDAASKFAPTDVPIYCVVMLDSTAPVTVRMNLVAAKVTGVKPDSKVLSVSYTTKDGQNRVNFTGRPAGKWVAGTYRVDIFLNDKFIKDVSFDVTQPVKSATTTRPLPPTATAKSVATKSKN